MIPGLNILGLAAQAIGLQTLTHYACTGRGVDAYGNFVATYAAPASIQGSLQPVDSATYALRGLDVAKTYYSLYTTANVVGVHRDSAGDKVVYAGKTYQAVGETSWANVGEWRNVLLVEVQDD